MSALGVGAGGEAAVSFFCFFVGRCSGPGGESDTVTAAGGGVGDPPPAPAAALAAVWDRVRRCMLM